MERLSAFMDLHGDNYRNSVHVPCDPSSGSKSCAKSSLEGLCGISPGPCADVISFGTPYGDPRVFAGELLVREGFASYCYDGS